MSRVCSCFGGCRKIEKIGLRESLEVVLEYLIEKENVDVFCFGGMGKFDELCVDVANKLKHKHKNISLFLILPEHKTLAKELESKNKGRFDKIITIKNKEGLKLPILSRNIEMAKVSAFIVFFANESGRGNETKVLKFAKEHNIPFVNLFS